jgi:hypothetical protein
MKKIVALLALAFAVSCASYHDTNQASNGAVPAAQNR